MIDISRSGHYVGDCRELLKQLPDACVQTCVHIDMRMPTRLLTSLEAVQFGMAMQEASRVAAEMRVKMERRKR